MNNVPKKLNTTERKMKILYRRKQMPNISRTAASGEFDLKKAGKKEQYSDKYSKHAKDALARYSKTVEPKIVEVQSSKDMKAIEKNKIVARIKRMLKYLQQGVELSDEVISMRNSKTPPPIHISKDNTKLKRDNIVSFNLPAGHTCPSKGQCHGFCYAQQGPQSWPAAVNARNENWASAEREDFVPRMNQLFKDAKKPMIVRLHDSGDLYNQAYIDKWHDIAKANPQHKFYAYTKALDLDWKKLHNLPNFNVVQSVGGLHDDKIDPNYPHAYIFPDEAAIKKAGYIDMSQSDLPTSNKKNIRLGLPVHGGLSGQYNQEKIGQQLQFQPQVKKSQDLKKSDMGHGTKNYPLEKDDPSNPAQRSGIIAKIPQEKSKPSMWHGMLNDVGAIKSEHLPLSHSTDQIDAPSQLAHESNKPIAKLSEIVNASVGIHQPRSEHNSMWHNILNPKQPLKKQDAMGAAASSIRGAFGGTSITPPPPPPPPPPVPTSTDSGSLASNITRGLSTMMGKSDEPLDKKFKPKHEPTGDEEYDNIMDRLISEGHPKEYAEEATQSLLGRKPKIQKEPLEKIRLPAMPQSLYDPAEKRALAFKRHYTSKYAQRLRERLLRRSEENPAESLKKSEDLEKKQGVPEGVDTAKMERCVTAVKRQGGKYNPWAVCAASLQKMKKSISDLAKGDVVDIKSKKILSSTPTEATSVSNPQLRVAGEKSKMIGRTRSGKDIYSEANSSAHKGFTREDHADAIKIHNNKMDEMDKKLAGGVLGGTESRQYYKGNNFEADKAKYLHHLHQQEQHQNYIEPSRMNKTEPMDKKYVGFKKLESKLSGKVSNPGAVAASIGREKYGKKAFQESAAAGKKMNKSDCLPNFHRMSELVKKSYSSGCMPKLSKGDIIEAKHRFQQRGEAAKKQRIQETAAQQPKTIERIATVKKLGTAMDKIKKQPMNKSTRFDYFSNSIPTYLGTRKGSHVYRIGKHHIEINNTVDPKVWKAIHGENGLHIGSGKTRHGALMDAISSLRMRGELPKNKTNQGDLNKAQYAKTEPVAARKLENQEQQKVEQRQQKVGEALKQDAKSFIQHQKGQKFSASSGVSNAVPKTTLKTVNPIKAGDMINKSEDLDKEQKQPIPKEHKMPTFQKG